MVTYQFEIDDDLWETWKNTVPRSKSLDTRIRELIRDDAGVEEAETGSLLQNRHEEPDSEDATPGVDTGETTFHTPGEDASDDLDEVLSGWRPGRSPGEKQEQQRGAGRAALEYLAERGTATAAEFREDVEPDHPVEGQSPSTWWKKSARPALKRARDRGLVTFKDGSKEWRWKGGE